jgi:hypothetical protein
MKYATKLKKQHDVNLWGEYCGFIELDYPGFKKIQDRLMEEQIKVWSDSGIGQSILKGKHPRNIDEFRRMVPLTKYEDYADILLNRRVDMLPEEPVIWLETTWEGGRHPVKTAPYTNGMLEAFNNNMLSIMTFASSRERNQSLLREKDRVLFGLAPLPYVTGLFPLVLDREIKFNFLPPVKEANAMSFSERNKVGFKMGLAGGIDGFFGMTSIIAYMTEHFSKSAGSHHSGGSGDDEAGSIYRMKPKMIGRYLKAKSTCKKENRPMLPRDIFRLKALVCAGTDTACYKQQLQDAWGITLQEIFAGTEMSLLCTETTSHDGMVFFPDSCFPEFIREEDSIRCQDDPTYQPKTLLLEELEEGKNYELVITSLKGGAFARYRVGDMFRCISRYGDASTKLPLVSFIDRIRDVIDIAGFTRITKNSVSDVVSLSRLPIEDWVARKEFFEGKRPYMHMYIEIRPDSVDNSELSVQVLREHLKVYFKSLDTDYDDLEKILGIDPLKITVLKCGTFNKYYEREGKRISHMNPSTYEINELIEHNILR